MDITIICVFGSGYRFIKLICGSFSGVNFQCYLLRCLKLETALVVVQLLIPKKLYRIKTSGLQHSAKKKKLSIVKCTQH